MMSKLRSLLGLAVIASMVVALVSAASSRGSAGASGLRSPAATQVSLATPHAAWSVRGANIQSTSRTYFGSAEFFSAVRSLRATGANSVKMIVQLYQSAFTSSNIFAGSVTPYDGALEQGIAYARSQHLQVSVSIHDDRVDPGDGSVNWRGLIDPSGAARTHWFGSYGSWLLHYARIAKDSGAWSLALGTEMLKMTGAADAPHWISIIRRIRSADSGLRLMYEADQNELVRRTVRHATQGDSIAFDKYLNFMGISSYVPLVTWDHPTFSFMQASMDLRNWFALEVAPLIRRFGDRVIVTEAGYSSAPGTLSAPFKYLGSSSVYDQLSQLRGYQSLFALLAHQAGVMGMFLWEWGPTSASGGPADANFTPQAKSAEGLIRYYWGANAVAVPMPSTDNGGDGIYTLKARASGWPIGSYVVRYSLGGAPSRPMYPVATGVAHYEGNVDLSRSAIGPQTVTYSIYDPAGHFLSAAEQVLPVTSPVSQISAVDTWWPTVLAGPLRGLQPFQARIDGLDTSEYTMGWQVDGGVPGAMQLVDDPTVGPYFSANVDVDNFTWRGPGPYYITFLARDLDGVVIGISTPIPLVTQ